MCITNNAAQKTNKQKIVRGAFLSQGYWADVYKFIEGSEVDIIGWGKKSDTKNLHLASLFCSGCSDFVFFVHSETF